MKIIVRTIGALLAMAVIATCVIVVWRQYIKDRTETRRETMAACIVQNLSKQAKAVIAEDANAPLEFRKGIDDEARSVVDTVVRERCATFMNVDTADESNYLDGNVRWGALPDALDRDKEYAEVAKPFVDARQAWDAKRQANLEAEQTRKDSENRARAEQRRLASSWMLK